MSVAELNRWVRELVASAPTPEVVHERCGAVLRVVLDAAYASHEPRARSALGLAVVMAILAGWTEERLHRAVRDVWPALAGKVREFQADQAAQIVNAALKEAKREVRRGA